MGTFTTKSERSALDERKHVRYVRGMVLGVDEFEQEFAYLSGRDRWLARDALGYGTLCGLSVRADGSEVTVGTGSALTPRGQLVRVAEPQCARLDEWLALDVGRDAAEAAATSPPSALTLYVVLDYQACPTDRVPIPGEPCRSEDDAMAASRVTDDFTLELRRVAPDGLEEEGVRAFAAWLAGIEVGEGPSTPLATVLAAARAVVPLGAAADASPPEPVASPLEALVVSAADAPHYLREALRLWVTELRGAWRRPDGDCVGSAPDEGVLLAELRVPIEAFDGGWRVAGDVTVDESRRPYLLSLRMLQELLLGARGAAPAVEGPQLVEEEDEDEDEAAGGDLSGTLADARAIGLQGTPVTADPPTEGDVLTFRGGRWQPAAAATDGRADGAVTHDRGADGFGIVAAGIVGLRGAAMSPVYPDDLRLEAPGHPGAVVLRFSGYENPFRRTFKYVVKALPRAAVGEELFRGGRLGPRARAILAESVPLVVNFLGFDDDGIWLQVFQNGAPLDRVEGVSLVVEVSRFPHEPGR